MFKHNDIVIQKKTGLEFRISCQSVSGQMYLQWKDGPTQWLVYPTQFLGFHRWFYESELMLKSQWEYNNEFNELLK